MKTLYVGNLPYSASEDDLHELFARYGRVGSVKLVMDRDTGRPRGFAFVEMENGAEEALRSLDGSDYGGRNLRVNEAQPKPTHGARRPRS